MPYIDFKQLVELETEVAATAPIAWQSAGRSHPGRVRSANEDAFYGSAQQGLWAVADGMGGLARGDYASGVVAEAFVHFVKLKSLAACIRDLEMRLRQAHSKCRHSFPGERVGSTVAALFNYGQYGFLLWAGDSRVYRLRAGRLDLLTTDHTVAQDKLSRGELTPAQAERHPSAHVLTRAVGVHQTLHLELDYGLVEPGDRYLVCSDGLYKELVADDIQRLLGPGSVNQAVEALVEGALERGGSDNITAIVVEAGSVS